MSAANVYQPHVYIDGVKLRETRDGSGPVAVANIRIKWGSPSWFDNIDPAQLTLVVLDPRPDFATTAATRNAPVKITRDPDNTIVFIGNVIEATTTQVQLTDARTGRRVHTFEHRIIAEDPLGLLARDRKRGQTWPSREGEDLVAHWGPGTIHERRTDLQTRCPVKINFAPTSIEEWTAANVFGFDWPVTAYERQQIVSVLTVLRNTMRIDTPLARPYYDPATNTINPVSPPAPSPGFTIIATSTDYALVTQENLQFNGDEIEMTSGVTASSTALEQVTRVELQLRDVRFNQSNKSTSRTDDSRQVIIWIDHTTAIEPVTGPGGQLTVSLESDHNGLYYDDTDQVPLKNYLNERIRGIYGMGLLPPMRYTFAKHEPADPAFIKLLNPTIPINFHGRPDVYRVVNSQLNQFGNTGAFAITGGELTYTHKQGWQHTFTPAAVGTAQPPTEPTLADFTEDAPLNSAAPQILADWQQVTSIWNIT